MSLEAYPDRATDLEPEVHAFVMSVFTSVK